MKRACYSIIYLLGLTIPAAAFVIDEDSVNFTALSQSIYLINNSDSSITIDTIKLYKSNKTYFNYVPSLIFDTVKVPDYSQFGTFHAPYFYNINTSSLPTNAVRATGKGISIGKRGFLKLSAGYFSTSLVGKRAQTLPNVPKDTLNLMFISSNHQKDSIHVILYSFLFGTKAMSHPITMKNMPAKLPHTYLLNGRVTDNKGLLRDKNKIVIKK